MGYTQDCLYHPTHIATNVRLAEAETLLKGMAKRHDGYEEGIGPCICEWHQKVRAFFDKSDERKVP